MLRTHENFLFRTSPLVLALWLTVPTSAQSALENLPYSTSALVARAVLAGRIHVSNQAGGPEFTNPALTCSSPPCVLPNVDASPGGTNPINETPVIVNPKNAQQILTGGNDLTCLSATSFYASSDGGTTWNSFCRKPSKGNNSGGGDPIVAYDLKGNSYIGGIDFGGPKPPTIGLQKSTNNGKTWGSPFTSVKYLFTGGFVDKPWLQIDINPKSKFANSLYVSATQIDGSNNSEISVSNSHDAGKTWKTVAVDPLQTYPNFVDQFSDLAVGADGTVFVTWLRCPASSGQCGGQKSSFYISESKDGGKTWSKPSKMFNITLAGGSCGFYGCLPNTNERVSDIPAVDIDNSNGAHKGNLYVTYYTWTGTYMQVRVATSKDGGKIWTTKAVAPASNNHDQFFPWLSVSKTGIVGVSWLDRRNDPQNVNYESFGAFSTNGGSSFGKNQDLSANPSNPNNDGWGGTFMGDYTGNYWADSKTFYVTFTDTTTGTGQDFLGGYLR
jgi:hypothetical protein